MCTRSMYHWAIRLGCMIVFLACSAISGMALEDETVARKTTEDAQTKDTHVKKAIERGKKVREGAQEALKKGERAVQAGAQKVQERGKKVLEGGKDAARAVVTKAKAAKDKVKEASENVKDRGLKIIDEAEKKLKGRGEKQGAPSGGQLPENDRPTGPPKAAKP